MENKEFTEVSPYGPLYIEIVEHFDEKMIGQKEAKHIVASYLANSFSDIYEKKGPIGVFFCSGPTGVGKTMLAEQTASLLFGSENALTKIECEKLQQSHEAALLFGAPPGYIGHYKGGLLSPDIIYKHYHEAGESGTLHKLGKRYKNMGILLFDEIEKMNKKSIQSLLNLLSNGVITLQNGDEIDISNFLVFFTSNVGEHKSETKKIGFGGNQEEHKTSIRMNELKRMFAPEFLGRIDEFIEFEPASDDFSKLLIEKYKSELIEELEITYDDYIQVEIDTEVLENIQNNADLSKGNRSLQKMRNKLIKNKLGGVIKTNRIDKNADRNLIKISLEEDEIIFKTKKLELRKLEDMALKETEEYIDESMKEDINPTPVKTIIILDKDKTALLLGILSSLYKHKKPK